MAESEASLLARIDERTRSTAEGVGELKAEMKEIRAELKDHVRREELAAATGDLWGRVNEQEKAIAGKACDADVEAKLKSYVTVESFDPVKRVVYGAVGVALLAVGVAIVAMVVARPGERVSGSAAAAAAGGRP